MRSPHDLSGSDTGSARRNFATEPSTGSSWPFTHFHRMHIAPPLVISEDDLVRGLDVIDRALSIADDHAAR
jgi:taurine--2-oxoglutarate transaminase